MKCSNCGSTTVVLTVQSLFEETAHVDTDRVNPCIDEAEYGSQEWVEIIGVQEAMCENCGEAFNDDELKAIADLLGLAVVHERR